LIFNVYTESLNLWDSQLFIILFRWYKGWEIMLGFKKIFLSIQLSRLLKVSLKWQIIFSENGITDFSYFKIFFISSHDVRRRYLLFRLFRNSLMLFGWRSTLMVLLESVQVFQHVQVFFMVKYISSFSSFFGIQKSLFVQIMRVILVIELAWSKDFRRIWLECDSSLLC